MRSKLAIKNIILTVISQFITLVCGFMLSKLIISSYGSSVNGLVASITKFLAYITLFEFGFGPVVKSVLYKPIVYKNKEEIKQILKTSEKYFRRIAYIFLIYIFALCFIIPNMVSNEFSLGFTISLIIIIAISNFSEYYFGLTYSLYLQAEQKLYVILVIKSIALILNTIITVILIKLGASIHIVKLTTALIFVIRPILQNIYVKKKYNINLKQVEGNYKIDQKLDGMAQHIAYVVRNNTDILILTICSTMKEVSVYHVYLLIIASIKNAFQGLINGIDAAFGDMIAKNEIDNLNKILKIYEVIYFTFLTIVFSVVIFLIVPFVGVYTRDISDVNYIRPTFAIIIVFSEFIWAIREPYNTIVKAAGKFKETKLGAWLEAIVNFVISIVLVWKYGLVGVAIGTLISISIRAMEYMYYTSKHILKRSLKYNFRYLIVIAVEVFIITYVVRLLPKVDIINYIDCIIQAIKVTIIASIIVILINSILYNKDIKDIMNFIKCFTKIKSKGANTK